MKITKEFIELLEKQKLDIYSDPDSVLSEFEDYLYSKGLELSVDSVTFHKILKGRMDLCEDVLSFYYKSKLPNEKISFLDDLFVIGYDKNKLTEIILDSFFSGNRPSNLWEYGELLHRLKNFKYLSMYLKIITDDTLGTARQMVVLLVGKSKKAETVPFLKSLLNDQDVYGHALEALANFEGQDIEEIMYYFLNCKVTWIKNTAKNYLKKRKLLE